MNIRGQDGNIRDHEAENLIAEAVQLTFKSPAGEFLLRHLEGLTIRAIGGPRISNDELRHLEGQRFVVGLIRNYLNAPRRTPNERASRQSRTQDPGPAPSSE